MPPGRRHRPGREAERVSLLFGSEFLRAHESILITHGAVGEGEALNQPVAVEQMRFAQTAALEKAGAVAIERPS
jgi:hypothetical protein